MVVDADVLLTEIRAIRADLASAREQISALTRAVDSLPCHTRGTEIANLVAWTSRHDGMREADSALAAAGYRRIGAIIAATGVLAAGAGVLVRALM